MNGTGDESTRGAADASQRFLDEFLSSMDGWDTAETHESPADTADTHESSDAADDPSGGRDPGFGPAPS